MLSFNLSDAPKGIQGVVLPHSVKDEYNLLTRLYQLCTIGFCPVSVMAASFIHLLLHIPLV